MRRSPQGPPTDPAGRSGLQAQPPRSLPARALLAQRDRMGEQVGIYVSLFGRALLKVAARAREEAEDIWAEAEHIRRSRQS